MSFLIYRARQINPWCIQVFNSKIISLLLYGVAVWILVITGHFYHPICQFISKIMGVHHCVSDVCLRAELSQKSLEARAWDNTCKLRVRIIYA